jgi:hypothetical protein
MNSFNEYCINKIKSNGNIYSTSEKQLQKEIENNKLFEDLKLQLSALENSIQLSKKNKEYTLNILKKYNEILYNDNINIDMSDNLKILIEQEKCIDVLNLMNKLN